MRFSQFKVLQEKRVPDTDSAEAGFLMLGTLVMLIVIVAIVSSYAFVARRDANFKANYAAGQRLAELAVMAHNFAQTRFYSTTPGTSIEGTDLYNAANINPPDNFAFGTINRTTYQVEVRGSNAAPINTSATFRAPSAYILLRIRTPAGFGRSATDTVALLAGAASAGLTRVGIVDAQTITATSTCDGVANSATPADPIRVIWGPGPTACLRQSQIVSAAPTGIGFTNNIQAGDIIIPAWETAYSRVDTDAIFRFPQPEHPEAETASMGTGDLRMNGNDINGINNTRTTNIDEHFGTNPAASARIRGTLLVRQGSNADLRGGATTQGDLRVLSPVQPALQVLDDVALTNDVTLNPNNVNVAGTIQKGANPLNVTVTNDPMINRINNTTATMTRVEPVSPGGTTTSVNADIIDPTSNITSMTVSNPNQRLNVTGTLDTTGATIHPQAGNTDIYAAQMNVPVGGSQIVSNGSAPMDWNVGSVEQKGSASGPGTGLILSRINVQKDCVGRACPNAITNPGGGGF